MTEYFVKQRLPEFLSQAPVSWKNFIRYLENKNAKQIDDASGGYSVETINEYLARYDAEYTDFNHYGILEFTTQRGHLLYIMQFDFAES